MRTYTEAHDCNRRRLNVGDPVMDIDGARGVVEHIEDPDLDQPPYVRVRFDDGDTVNYSLTRDWCDGPEYTDELEGIS